MALQSSSIDQNNNVKVTLETGLDPINDEVSIRPEGFSFSNITATATVRTGETILHGMYVNSTSSGTIKLYDNTAASGTVIFNTITPSVGWHSFGDVRPTTGVHAVIGGTLDVTIVYKDATDQ